MGILQTLDASSVMTLVSFLTFVGIVVWTYRHRETDFAKAAALPFADEEEHHG